MEGLLEYLISRGITEPMPYNIFTTMLSIWTGLGEDSSDSVSDTDCSLDEEAIITYYFNRGFDYSEILLFLVKHHDHTLISLSFLLPSTPLARLILLQSSSFFFFFVNFVFHCFPFNILIKGLQSLRCVYLGSRICRQHENKSCCNQWLFFERVMKIFHCLKFMCTICLLCAVS